MNVDDLDQFAQLHYFPLIASKNVCSSRSFVNDFLLFYEIMNQLRSNNEYKLVRKTHINEMSYATINHRFIHLSMNEFVLFCFVSKYQLINAVLEDVK